jgi:hypothetical protein
MLVVKERVPRAMTSWGLAPQSLSTLSKGRVMFNVESYGPIGVVVLDDVEE